MKFKCFFLFLLLYAVNSYAVTYIALENETVITISQKFKIPLKALIDENPDNFFSADEPVIPGTEMNIPTIYIESQMNKKLITHLVLKNEILNDIAKKYKTSALEIQKLNPHIENINLIYEGDIIIVYKDPDLDISLLINMEKETNLRTKKTEEITPVVEPEPEPEPVKEKTPEEKYHYLAINTGAVIPAGFLAPRFKTSFYAELDYTYPVFNYYNIQPICSIEFSNFISKDRDNVADSELSVFSMSAGLVHSYSPSLLKEKNMFMLSTVKFNLNFITFQNENMKSSDNYLYPGTSVNTSLNYIFSEKISAGINTGYNIIFSSPEVLHFVNVGLNINYKL
ncbi:MAG: LysM peptidoglycan-binding domain-containing protein [Spirochaetes bacterium]|nr:LysM peptidoglycan-binding domain-containing protein [Spirochaetota bacterium]